MDLCIYSTFILFTMTGESRCLCFNNVSLVIVTRTSSLWISFLFYPDKTVVVETGNIIVLSVIKINLMYKTTVRDCY